MAYRRDEFAPGEWYHCYNRGVDKRTVFESDYDYERFLEALYLCNNTQPKRSHIWTRVGHVEIMQTPRISPLVAIAAYCLMPNHFHLMLKESVEGGISAFMHKVGTAYTMYFNKKNERTGNLFVKPFRSRRISTEGHFAHLPNYIHLNPAELFEYGWKEGNVKDFSKLETHLRNYRYSSLPEYCGSQRPESVILDEETTREFISPNFSTRKIIADAAEYYAGLKW